VMEKMVVAMTGTNKAAVSLITILFLSRSRLNISSMFHRKVHGNRKLKTYKQAHTVETDKRTIKCNTASSQLNSFSQIRSNCWRQEIDGAA